MKSNTLITGTGSYLPEKVVPNKAFHSNVFYGADGAVITKPNAAIVAKLEQISGIRERRYVEDDQDTAQIAAIAGQRAIEDAGLTGEELDGIIVAHDVGNLVPGEAQAHTIPNLAALVKHHLGIQNHRCSAFDLMFGCPGWLEGVILAHQRMASGNARAVLVIGVEIISRRLDPFDLDSMLFSDGAGAVVLQAKPAGEKKGVLVYQTYSHCNEEVDFLKMGKSYKEPLNGGHYLKMQGRKVYKYALNTIPDLVDECLEKGGFSLSEVSKFIMHQSNEKMILTIADKICKRHGLEAPIEKLLPMTVQQYGNSSVATIPTMLDLILKREMMPHLIREGDLLVFTSVGAGMHANCLIYRV